MQGLATYGALPGGFSAASLAAAAQQMQGLAGLQAAQASAMRVAVDKGRATEYDHTFVAEDTTAKSKDHADEVMRRCEEVTQMLRKTLGKHTEGDRRAQRGGGSGGRAAGGQLECE